VRRIITLIVGNDPSAGRGGHTRYVRAHGRAAIAAGYEPHIFCAYPRTEVIRTDYGFIHRVASPCRPFRHLMVIGHARYLTRSIERFLTQTQGPHLIHSSGVWADVGRKVASRVRRRGVTVVHVATSYDLLLNEARAKLPGVTRAHGFATWLNHFVQLLWIKLLVHGREGRGYRDAACVVVNYESVRRLLHASFGAGLLVRKLPYTSETAYIVQPNKRSPAPAPITELRPGDAPLIVCVSRHDPRKGVDVLLHALAKLRQEGTAFRACLIGGGVLLDAHRALRDRLRLADCVAILGFVPDSFVYLEHADLFVLPSLEEGSGSMSVIEALQAGVATVATGVDGIPEDLTHDRSALLVRPNDAVELSAAIRRVLEDQELRSRLARGARAVFTERFLPENFSTALRQTYEELGFR
jgi:glycosyltransferase involved in cell wall biosynthesis